MAGRAPLRAVTEQDAAAAAKPKRTRPKTLAQAAENGTYLEILVAQRREMIRDVKSASGPAKAAIYRQIALASKEIAALEAAAAEEAAEDAEADATDEDFSAEAL